MLFFNDILPISSKKKKELDKVGARSGNFYVSNREILSGNVDHSTEKEGWLDHSTEKEGWTLADCMMASSPLFHLE